MDNQTVITNAKVQLRNFFVNITEHPVRAQGTSTGAQYSDEEITEVAGDDIQLLHYKFETNYPHTKGTLNEVYYEISFEIKAMSAAANVTYQLQARNEDTDTWIDMSAAVEVNIGTSYVAKTIKGYLHIQEGITLMPFEMQLIFKSDEGSAKRVDTWTATAAYTSSTIWNCFAKYSLKPTRVYGGVNIPIHNYRVVAWYNETTNAWTACGQVSGPQAVSECRCMLEWNNGSGARLYIGTDQTISSTTDTSWSQVYNSPKDIYGLCLHTYGTEKMYAATGKNSEGGADGQVWVGTGPAEANWSACAAHPLDATKCYCLVDYNDKLYVGTTPSAKVFVTADGGATWTQTGIAAPITGTHVYCLIANGDYIYAGTDSGEIWRLNVLADTWARVATSAELGTATAVRALALFNSKLYAGTDPGDVYHSIDGTTWVASGDLSGATTIRAIVKPATTAYPLRVYAGVNGDNPFYGALVSGEGYGKIKNDTLITTKGRIIT